MKIIVTGGRNYEDYKAVDKALSSLSPTLIVEGGAKGADRLAREWAIENGIEFITVNAEWAKYAGRAGTIRNAKMLALHSDATVVVFPGGRGTADCEAKAREKEMKIVVVK